MVMVLEKKNLLWNHNKPDYLSKARFCSEKYMGDDTVF